MVRRHFQREHQRLTRRRAFTRKSILKQTQGACTLRFLIQNNSANSVVCRLRSTPRSVAHLSVSAASSRDEPSSWCRTSESSRLGVPNGQTAFIQSSSLNYRNKVPARE